MFTVVDLRKFENYFYSDEPLGEWHRDCKKLQKQEGVFGISGIIKDTLFLARDFVGEMPFCFFVSRKTRRIYISNTIADLREYPEYEYRSVRAVPPGCYTHISLLNGTVRYIPYYRLTRLSISIDIAEVAKKLRAHLIHAVRRRLPQRDKKFAVLLSGGSDSFTISYLLSQCQKNLTAYTLTIDGKGQDLPQAKAAAQFLKVPLIQVDVASAEVVEVVEDVVRLSELYKDYDVYMAVGSYFLARAVKKDGIKNVFTGEGANELFGDYGSWGSFSINRSTIVSKRFRRLMVFGRRLNDPYYNHQLGSGLGKSLSRLNKVFFHHGVKAHNPFLDREVIEYLLALPKSFLRKYTKQEILRRAFPEVPPSLFPPKIRLQDGAGITRILAQRKITNERLKQFYAKFFIVKN